MTDTITAQFTLTKGEMAKRITQASVRLPHSRVVQEFKATFGPVQKWKAAHA
jgi:hypothetical protein